MAEPWRRQRPPDELERVMLQSDAAWPEDPDDEPAPKRVRHLSTLIAFDLGCIIKLAIARILVM